MMRKRWISILVENDIGVLARIATLFSAKSYNLNSLTVGTTEDETISRMTISLISDDRTFEQVKKQLDRCVEVIEVIDLTDSMLYTREVMFIKLSSLTEEEIAEISHTVQKIGVQVVDHSLNGIILECSQTENQNDALISQLCQKYEGRMEITRGGSVAVEAFSIADRAN